MTAVFVMKSILTRMIICESGTSLPCEGNSYASFIAELMIIAKKTVPVRNTIHRQQKKFFTIQLDARETPIRYEFRLTGQTMRYELPQTGEAEHFAVNIL